MFEVSGDYRVDIQARDGRGRIHQVAHCFRPAGKEELLEYERRLPRQEFTRGGPIRVGSVTDAQLYLWDQLIVRVEGYTISNEDLMTRPDWKDLVPLEHRTVAVAMHYETRLTPAGEGEDQDDPFDSSSAAGSSAPKPAPAARE
jgi:hypothetical protein